MKTSATPDLSTELVALAAECLRMPAGELDQRAPLSRYNLDSLAAVELTAAIEQLVERPMPDWLLQEHPTLEAVRRYLEMQGVVDEGPECEVELMRKDRVLPAEFQPPAGTRRNASGVAVLLTGATGFLGAHLLRSILSKTSSTVYCLVRPTRGEATAERISHALQRYAIRDASFAPRIRTLEGDVTSPRLGLDEQPYQELADRVGTIYHCAAAVDWVSSYRALRAANVLGTLELTRFACTSCPKTLEFVSTASTCYSTRGPREVGEDGDTFAYVDGIHLGYARSKCVGEALVRQAGERGLPCRIYRPALISGDRVTGISNPDDLLSRMTRAVVLMGEAPDLDWDLDCCPVDYVADAIVHLAGEPSGLEAFHLVNPSPRHWREYVLWMNLFGYPVRLVPYARWIGRLEAVTEQDHPLWALKPFFSRRPPGEGGLTLPELYEVPRRSRVRSEHTRAALQSSRIEPPELSAQLLERYFRNYIDSGFLPETGHRRQGRTTGVRPHLDPGLFTPLLRRYYRNDSIHVCDVDTDRASSPYSIISELTSWKHACASGIQRCLLTLTRSDGEPEHLRVVVKTMTRDRYAMDVAKSIAAQCSPELGRAFQRFDRHVGLTGAHVRELGIYQQQDERFRRHAPALYGTVRKGRDARWMLVMEDVSDLALMNSADDVSGWNPERIEAALQGLARLHAIWYRSERRLLRQRWLGPVITPARKAKMLPLWTALAEFAAGRFGCEGEDEFMTVQRSLVTTVGERALQMQKLPRTLIHHDFNPRNIGLRQDHGSFRLCAYDWELATLGLPQHDLAEFLCFVLPATLTRQDVMHYLELQRKLLEEASGFPIDARMWHRGFRLALHDLLVDRFAMYAMVDRFRPQRFLRRIISTWRALYDLFPIEDLEP